MQVETLIEITDKHTDELDHLNHVEAVRLFELARDDWYAKCGLYGESGKDFSLSPMVVNINFNYRQECFLGERISIITRPGSRGSKSVLLENELRKPDGTVAIEGTAVSVIMDMAARAAIPVPECIAMHLPERDS